MARGVPVVASRAPSLGEIFVGAATLVEPRDEMAVADAIGTVLGDAAWRAGMVRRGLLLASGFSWKATAERTWQCLVAAAGA